MARIFTVGFEEEVWPMNYGHKFKCPWCGYQHYTTRGGGTCWIVICPVYREPFRVVINPVVCLACSKPCKERKASSTEITSKLDRALRGVAI